MQLCPTAPDPNQRTCQSDADLRVIAIMHAHTYTMASIV